MNRTCQVCHGPELKGDRGPALDTVVSRLGADDDPQHHHQRQRRHAGIRNAAGAIDEPPAGVSEAKPDLAPPGSAPSAAMQAMVRSYAEPAYPEGVDAPPSRYKTGYGNEPYVIGPPWSTITAYDLNTGKIKWQTPFGDLPQARPE